MAFTCCPTYCVALIAVLGGRRTDCHRLQLALHQRVVRIAPVAGQERGLIVCRHPIVVARVARQGMIECLGGRRKEKE